MKPDFTPYKKKIMRVMAHRTMGIILSAAMVFHMLPVGEMTVYASKETAELCRHYPEYTAGYAYEAAAALASGAIEVSNALDFSGTVTDSGDLDTQGYHWDSSNNKLQLKNVRINSTVTLPDAAVTIETTGDCSIQELSAANANPQTTKLNFTGTGTLTVEQKINISGGNGNILTVAAGASVIAEGGISIGASGGMDSTVTVYGTLAAKSAGTLPGPAIYAGTVVVGNGGLLEVSGKQGVQLNGMNTGSSYNVAGVFTVQEGGCFQADCEEYNVRALPNGSAFPSGSNPDQAFRIPEGYLPADCKVKWVADAVNLVKKSNEVVYTGPLIIGRSNSSPDDSRLAVTLSGADGLIYDGQEKRPGVTVTLDGAVLDASNYDITYSNNINAGEASVTVTGKGGLNFTRTVNFQIARAVPVITWDPAAQTVIYSGSQAAVTPPAVTLANGEIFDGEIRYSYAAEGSAGFTDGLPANAGTYIVKAGIPEQGNYTAADSTDPLKLTVEKAEYPPNKPSDVMRVAERYKKVKDVKLPAGWEWKESDKNTGLRKGVPQKATAVYVGEDKDNYKNITAIVTIIRADSNENTESTYRPAGGSGNGFTNPADGSGDSSSKPDSKDMTVKSPMTGGGDPGQQSGQSRRPWEIMAAGALFVMGIGGVSAARRKKRESRGLSGK